MNRGQPLATLIAARVLGPLLLAFGIAMIAQRQRMLAVIEGFIDDDNLLVLGGALSLLIGLVIVALHDGWRGFTQIVVSVLGWFSVIRGAAVLFAPNLVRTAAANVLVNPQIVPIVGCLLALLGLWLSFVGFTGRREEDEPLGQIR
ncbi:MAG TPA: hypothetical protein VG841_08280 [Caulobacterales bacterium]|nr:hypothetical protein [Caulobacterales bacterium]